MDFLERMREEEATRNKMFLILFVIITVIFGIMILVQSLSMMYENPFISKPLCEINLTSSFSLEKTPKDLDDMVLSLAETKNISQNDFRFMVFGSESNCNNFLGYWIDLQKFQKRFLVCSNNNNVFEYNVIQCNRFDILKAILDSFDIFKKIFFRKL